MLHLGMVALLMRCLKVFSNLVLEHHDPMTSKPIFSSSCMLLPRAPLLLPQAGMAYAQDGQSAQD